MKYIRIKNSVIVTVSRQCSSKKPDNYKTSRIRLCLDDIIS